MQNERDDILSLVATLLRRPADLMKQADDPATLSRLAPRLLAITFVGAGTFGLVVGSYRQGLQYLFAALKMPLLILIPIAVTVPALRAIYSLEGEGVSYSRAALASLTGLARSGVLLAALGPALWLLLDNGALDYHQAILATVGCLALAGMPGLVTITSALPRQRSRIKMCAAATLMGLVLAQTGWLLRPFIARPRAEVALLRPVESDIFSSLAATARSARGDYRGWEMEAPALFEGSFERRQLRSRIVDIEVQPQESP